MLTRDTRTVIEHHIECRSRAQLDEDLDENYAEDVVLLSAEGTHRGHDGVRELAGILHRYLGDAAFDIRDVHVADEYGLERWSARSGDRNIHGTDSFVVRDGRIVAQTIYFVVRDAGC